MALNFRQVVEATEEFNKPGEKYKVGGMSSTKDAAKSAGSRNTMSFQQIEQNIVIANADSPNVFSGFENVMGKFSNGYRIADSDYLIIDKIERHTSLPMVKYLLIVQDLKTKIFDIVEVNHYENLSEIHGYRRPETNVDTKVPGDVVNKDECFYKSPTIDEFGNYNYGINAKVCFSNDMYTSEDAFVISEDFAKRVKYHKVDEISIALNSNELLLNLYGDHDTYLPLPFVGQDITDYGVLVSKRRIESNKAAANLTDNSVRQARYGDMMFKGRGKIVDIDIYCNKPEEFEMENIQPHRQQIKYIYEDQLRYHKRIADTLSNIVAGSNSSYTPILKHYYDISLNYINNSFNPNRDFSIKYTDYNDIEFCLIVIKTATLSHLQQDNKLSTRWGGKGIIIETRETRFMPIDKYGNRAEVLIYSPSILNRAIIGQNYEHELNFISSVIISRMNEVSTLQGKFDILIEYIGILTPKQAKALRKYYNGLTTREKQEFFYDINDNGIKIHDQPMEGIYLQELKDAYTKLDIQPSYIRTKERFKHTPVTRKRYIGQKEADNIKDLCEYMKFDDAYRYTLKDYFANLKNNPDTAYMWNDSYRYTLKDYYERKAETSNILDEIAKLLVIFSDAKYEMEKDNFDSKETFISYEIDEKTGEDYIVRDYRSHEPIVIGDIYMIVLRQEDETSFSARSVGDSDQLGLPAKSGKLKIIKPYSDTAIRLGVMEIACLNRLLSSEMIHRRQASVGSKPDMLEELSSMLLTEDPYDLHDLPYNNKDIQDTLPARQFHAYLMGLGCYITDTGEKDVFTKYDNLDEDQNIYFKNMEKELKNKN